MSLDLTKDFPPTRGLTPAAQEQRDEELKRAYTQGVEDAHLALVLETEHRLLFVRIRDITAVGNAMVSLTRYAKSATRRFADIPQDIADRIFKDFAA